MTTTYPLFSFGERLEGYSVPVLNERAVRAAAGIVFFFAIVSFMNAWLIGNFQPTRVFVVAFLVDFTIRIFVNPRYAPSLILGQWAVRKQQPEYVGAPQKRFAWAIGFVLALTMLYLVVIKHVIGPIQGSRPCRGGGGGPATGRCSRGGTLQGARLRQGDGA